jgi:radical SAM superfamily enzyme YgiQ (UPF0313 family)
MNCTSLAKAARVTWASFGEWRGYWFTALGVHTLAGYVQRHYGHELIQQVWYYDKKDMPNFLSCLSNSIPDYICLSVNIGYLEQALEVVEEIGNVLGVGDLLNTRFVFGNREFLDSRKVERVFEIIPEALVVYGEGEEAILKILNQCNLETIPNLYYRRCDQLSYTFDKRFDPNEHIAPLYEMVIVNKAPLGLNQQVAYVEVSRGCSKRPACSFCSNSIARESRWQMLNRPSS